MVSFQHPVYMNGLFQEFTQWKDFNEQYGSSNVTYIVRIELTRNAMLKEKKIKKHFRRFWLPGVIWAERNIRHHNMYYGNMSLSKARNNSQIDLWVIPKCFLRHNGISRIHRIARTMKLEVQHLRWLAKINYLEMEGYGPREVVEIAKQLTESVGRKWLKTAPISNVTFNTVRRSRKRPANFVREGNTTFKSRIVGTEPQMGQTSCP